MPPLDGALGFATVEPPISYHGYLKAPQAKIINSCTSIIDIVCVFSTCIRFPPARVPSETRTHTVGCRVGWTISTSGSQVLAFFAPRLDESNSDIYDPIVLNFLGEFSTHSQDRCQETPASAAQPTTPDSRVSCSRPWPLEELKNGSSAMIRWIANNIQSIAMIENLRVLNSSSLSRKQVEGLALWGRTFHGQGLLLSQGPKVINNNVHRDVSQ